MLDASPRPSVRLGDLCTVVRGGSPRPAGDPRFFGGSFIPWLTVAAITNVSSSKAVITETVGFLTESGALRSRRFQPGTVVIANSGWKCGVAKILGFECCGNDGVAGLQNLNGADPRLISYWINSQTEQLRSRSAAGNEQPNLDTDRIAGLMLPFPEVQEQKAIADALSDADALIEGLERLIAKKRLIKQGAMQDLLTAKRRLPGFSGEWVETPLGEIGPFVGGGTPSIARDDFWKEGTVPWVSSSDVRIGELHGAERLITVAAVKGSSTRVVEPGSILFVTRSGILRRFQPVMLNTVPVAINQDIKALLPRASEYSPSYVFHAAVGAGDQILRDCMKTGTTVESIDLSALRRFRIACPKDRDEQEAIAAALADMNAEIQALKTHLEKARQVKEGMMQNLLTGRIRLV